MTSELVAYANILKSKLNKWRLISLVLFLVIIAILAGQYNESSNKPHIAHVKLKGIILDDDYREKKLTEIENNSAVKAVIFSIDSPGGSAVASYKIFEHLKKISKSKPVVTTIDAQAASGGYMAALAGEKIFAYKDSLIGSIGTIMESPNISELANKIGVNFRLYKSSPLKATPNPFEKSNSEADKAMQDLIMESYNNFIELVANNRNMPLSQTLEVADGRVYLGSQAIKLKLIDQIGNKEDAKNWLNKHKLQNQYELIDYSLKAKNSILNEVLNELKILSNQHGLLTINY